MNNATKLLIADPQVVAREGLRSVIEKNTPLTVVGEAADGHTAVEMAYRLLPDLLFVDMLLPRLNGVETMRYVHDNEMRTKVIGWSFGCTTGDIDRFFEAGGHGYLNKNCAVDEILKAVEAVLVGETYRKIPATEPGAVPTRKAGVRGITPREREVLQLIAEGYSTRQAASILCVSIKTIETHRKNLMDKLNLHSVAALTKYAVREGVSSLNTVAEASS